VIKDALLNKMRNFIMVIMEWYTYSHVITGRGPGLFDGMVLRMFGPQWENVTGEVLGYHISVDEVSSLLGYEAVSFGNSLSVFWGN
jgi:hypothetical protein